ncbi:MAG: YicC family protein [Candidatus Cloacimonetes bacterium]|nr:YicC family protein [Candidatus Cloacimonadota bacterium]
MKSMTGFGSARFSKNNIDIEFEIKSVNSRYLDLRLYLPRDLSFYEANIRKRLPQVLSRGTVEVRLNYSDHREPKLHLDEAKLLKYKDLANAAAELLNIKSDVSIEYLLQEPGVIENINNLVDDKLLANMLDVAFDEALEKIQHSLEAESTQIRTVLKEAMNNIGNACAKVSNLSAPFKKDLFDNMYKRVGELVTAFKIENLELRIVQELAIYVDKYDIGEELSRINGHIETFLSTLESSADNGKTLNFIIQEMQREANTLGSKFSTSKSFPLVLIIKEEIEKCREIIQNVA